MKHAYMDLFIPIKIRLYNFAQVFKSNICWGIYTVYQDHNSGARDPFNNICTVFGRAVVAFFFLSCVDYVEQGKWRKSNQNLQLKIYGKFNSF